MLIVQAISCFFLVIAYLIKDKKNTASPFMILGLLSGVAMELGLIPIPEKCKKLEVELESEDAEEDLLSEEDLCDAVVDIEE